MEEPVTITPITKRSFTLIKNHKGLFFVFSVVVVLTTILIITNGNKSPGKISPRPTPTAVVITPAPTAPYFLNQLTNAVPSINGAAWVENKLYYSNNKGVYDAVNNLPLKKDAISYSSWSEKGTVIYFTGNDWRKYNVVSKTEGVLQNDLAYPKISPDGLYLADCKGSKIFIYELVGIGKTDKDLATNISKCFWLESSNLLAVETVVDNKSAIQIYNSKLEKQSVFDLEKQVSLVSISPDADFILINQDGVLKLINGVGKEISTISSGGSVYTASWIDNKNAFVIETQYDKQGQAVDYFWKCSVNGSKEYLTNSLPMAGRININIPVQFNKNKSAVTLVENNGRIWLLSLVAGKIAFYSDQGLSFTTMSAKGGE